MSISKTAPKAERINFSDAPDINKAAHSVAGRIRRVLDDEHDLGVKARALIAKRRHMSPSAITSLDVALREVIDNAIQLRKKLARENLKSVEVVK